MTSRTLSRVPESAGFIIGLDVGQAQDFTAVAVVEREARPSGRKVERGEVWDDHYTVRHLERPQLKTPYPEVVDRVCAIERSPKLAGRVQLVVDATGVGRPVVDMIRDRGLAPLPVTITGGHNVTEADGSWSVPKRVLVSAMAIALQSGRLHVARKLPLADVLAREMLNFKVKISVTAHDSYEAWREGEHDDLVLAVALAIWWGERTALGGIRLTEAEDAKERRRKAHMERAETPWWRAAAPRDRGDAAYWRRG